MVLTNKNLPLLKILLHFTTWFVLFLFPLVLTQDQNAPANLIHLLRFAWLPLLLYAAIFYTNYFFLTEQLLFRKKTLWFVLINIALISLFTFLQIEIKDFLKMVSEIKPAPMRGMPPPQKPPFKLFIYKDIISMLIPVIIAYAVKTNEKVAETEAQKKEKEKDILNSELQHLKYQLQPHFFFNSLNTIYALIERSPAVAQETVHSLAKLMRYMLYETESGKVNLNEEIDFMKQYVELMKLRLTDKTKIKVDFPTLSKSHQITPLLFISLLENAFKHGISATHPSELFFSLTVNDNSIRFFSENTNFPKTEKDKSGSGIGLLNLKKRLELTYPGNYKFETKSDGRVFTVLLEINTKA
ncbi:histidine kinase [Sphingobacteriaceae bacterium]|nr:histidine kinase [Sphingobacteriaceae bacterium]